MKAYKFLAAGARGRFSDVPWPLPTADAPGAWIEAGGPLEECRCGVHACTADELLDWIDDELWEVDLGGPIESGSAGLVSERGRLLRRLSRWDASLAAAFADRCADAARTRVEDALRQLGRNADADALAQARSLARVKAIAAACAGEEPSSPAAELTAFVADCLLLASGARPDAPAAGTPAGRARTAAAIAANLGFVSAHVAGRAAVATGDDSRYDAAFAAERERQLAWLRRRLAL